MISVLDPGGYGAVTITKSITIDGAGTMASILASSTSGVIINGANVKVVLRNLDIDGAPVTSPGLFGIRFLQGASLRVEHIAIRNFTGGTTPSGVFFGPSGTASLFLDDVSISNSGTAAAGAAIFVQPTGVGTRKIAIVNTTVENNQRGVFMDAAGSTGTIFATITDSAISNNLRGIQTTTPASGASTIKLTVDGVTLTNNVNQGILNSGATAEVRVGGSTITGNGTGVQVTAGILQSFKNNQISGNTADGTPITAVPGGPLN